MNKTFSDLAWEEYVQWQSEDKKTLRKINALLKDIERNGPLAGIGKPERLKHVSGLYSREIDEKNRLVYAYSAPETLVVIKCKGHYWDK